MNSVSALPLTAGQPTTSSVSGLSTTSIKHRKKSPICSSKSTAEIFIRNRYTEYSAALIRLLFLNDSDDAFQVFY